MSQKQAILEALQAGERLTGLIALQRFQCMTLAQRISELQRDGHAINSALVPNSPGGRKRVSQYWIDQPTGEQHDNGFEQLRTDREAEAGNAAGTHAAGG